VLIIVTVTKHAEKRMRQRLGLNKKSVQRMAEKALEEGIAHSDSKGRLHKYLDWQALSCGNKCKWRIYGEYIYCFSMQDVLITVLPLNNYLKECL
jgi:hypothetical protein